MKPLANGIPEANDNFNLPGGEIRQRAELALLQENGRRIDRRSGWAGISAFETGLGAALCDDEMAEAIRGAIRSELNRRRARLAMGELENEPS